MNPAKFPRLPLEGIFELTHRCNNRCVHCWIGQPAHDPARHDELSLSEIERIVAEARALGTRQWGISGGEPMLRPDFPEIFDLLTRKAVFYSLNTNGTLITGEIARLLRRKGNKMVALYGATAEVYDEVTRHPGGFEAAMRGFARLREAGAGFVVQLIPLRANWHQWEQMQELARSLSPHWRVGSPWLFLSGPESPERSRSIAAQRLEPRDVVALDPPNPIHDAEAAGAPAERLTGCGGAEASRDDDRLFASCIAGRTSFHVDPYGGLSWCGFVRDPALRYSLRGGTVREAWEEFIPACADRIRGGDEWRAHCGSCALRDGCRWCAVYARLETGRYSAPVPHLCDVAAEEQAYRRRWPDRHRRHFRVAGITVRLESDFDFTETAFPPELASFAVAEADGETVTLRHHFELPDLAGEDLGQELYRRPPWIVSRRDGTFYYRGVSSETGEGDPFRVGIFSAGHTHARIYSPPADAERVRTRGWHSLSLFPTDQIWLAPLLAERQAALIHSAAAIVNGQGLLFVGHSEAGKSTITRLLQHSRLQPARLQHAGLQPARLRASGKLDVEILCDDRNIVRRWDDGWRVHGTWSRGDVADVSAAAAPLRAILFLCKDPANEITPIADRGETRRRLLATLVRSVVTAQWWEKELDLVERLTREVVACRMRFDRSGAIVPLLERLVS